MTKAGKQIIDGLKEAITIKKLQEENEQLRRAMHEIYDVYVGSDANTSEAVYLEYLLEKIANIAFLHKGTPLKDNG